MQQGKQMTAITIPNTDLMVSPICLGTGEMGSGLNEKDSFKLLDLFFELGGNFLDTAHVYGSWVPGLQSPSEKTIGAWMKSRGNRQKMVIATKGAHPDLQTMHIPRMSSQEIIRDLNESLDHLQTDFIDLYWLHRDDPNRPVEDILETLESQVRVGKIRYYGASNWKTDRLREAWEYAEKRNITGFVADQSLWNVAVLAGTPYGDATLGWMDEERFRFHMETGMAMIPYQSQAFGLFQRMENGTLDQMNQGFLGFYKSIETGERFERMMHVKAQTGLTITQIVLGYLISQPFVTIPIVGSHKPEQVRDSLTAMNTRLTRQEIRYIESGALE
jgi:aryl-alcohol dehydrogenase-like predicted oxidoreductase